MLFKNKNPQAEAHGFLFRFVARFARLLIASHPRHVVEGSRSWNKLAVIIVVALIVGLIHIIPHIILLRSLNESRVYYPFTLAELLYAAQVREILDGNFFIGDPQFFEYKHNFPPIFPYLPPLVISLVSFLFGSVINGFLVSDFIFPFILFITLVGFIYTLTKKFWISVFLSVSTIIIYPLTIKIPPLTTDIFIGLIKKLSLLQVEQFLPFFRTPNPQLSYIIMIFAFWSLFLFWKKQQKKHFLASLIFGIFLFSTYFYHLVFFIFTVLMLLLISIIKKNLNLVKKLFLLLFLFGICAIFYQFLLNQPIYQSISITGGKFYTRYFDWIFTLRYGFFLLIFIALNRKWGSDLGLFCIAIILSAILSMNFQLFSGWTMQPGHFPQTTIEPTLVIVLGILLLPLLDKVRHALPLLTLLVLIYGFFYQVRFATANKGAWSISSDLNKVIVWIEKNTDKDTVVVSLDPSVLSYIPVLTKSNIFLPVEEYHYATIDEIWERLIYAFKIYQVKPEFIESSRFPIAMFFEQTYQVNKYKHDQLSDYQDKYVQLIKSCYPSLCSNIFAIPKSTINKVKQNYQDYDLKDNKYKVDYAIYSPFELGIGANIPKGKLVYTAGDYQILMLY